MLDLVTGLVVLAAFVSGAAVGFGVAIERWTHYRQTEIELLRAVIAELREDGNLDSRYLRALKRWWALKGELGRAEKLAGLFDE